jgi:hypothetical protein
MTLAGTSSLRHFLNNLQAKIFTPNCVSALLIRLIIIPLVPLEVPYFFFISSANAFSLDLSSRINVGSIPRLGSPIICAIILTVMGMGLPKHISPLCVNANNYLTHDVTYWPLQKSRSFNNLKMSILSSPTTH